MDLGKRIKYFRETKNMTQREMSKGICSVSYLSKIENNAVVPDMEMVEQLCDRLNISVNDIDKENKLLDAMKYDLIDLFQLIRTKQPNVSTKFEEILTRYKMLQSADAKQIKSLFGLQVALLLGDKSKAEELNIEVIEWKDYLPNWASTYFNRFCGLYHYMYGNLEQALGYYKEVEKSIPINEEGDIYYQLALVYSRLDKMAMSTFYLLKAHDIFMQKMDYRLTTNCNLLLGINYRKMGELEKAKESYLKIIEHLSEDKDTEVLGKTYHNLGIIYSISQEPQQAISYFEKSLKLKVYLQSKINTMFLMAKEYNTLKDYESAKEWINTGKRLAQQFGDQVNIIKFAVIEFEINNTANTCDFETYMTNIAIPFFEQRKEWDTYVEYVNKLAVYYECNRQYKQSYTLIKKLLGK